MRRTFQLRRPVALPGVPVDGSRPWRALASLRLNWFGHVYVAGPPISKPGLWPSGRNQSHIQTAFVGAVSFILAISTGLVPPSACHHYWLLLAESHLMRRFGAVMGADQALPCRPDRELRRAGKPSAGGGADNMCILGGASAGTFPDARVARDRKDEGNGSNGGVGCTIDCGQEPKAEILD